MDEHLSSRKSKCCRFCFLEKSITLFDLTTAWKTSVIIRKRLPEADRQFLTICILLANDPEQIVEIADAALAGLMTGPPLPLFATPIADAKWWVSVANLDERKAHLFACFHSLPDQLQRDFHSYVSEHLSK